MRLQQKGSYFSNSFTFSTLLVHICGVMDPMIPPPALQRSTSCKTSSPGGLTVPTKAKKTPYIINMIGVFQWKQGHLAPFYFWEIVMQRLPGTRIENLIPSGFSRCPAWWIRLALLSDIHNCKELQDTQKSIKIIYSAIAMQIFTMNWLEGHMIYNIGKPCHNWTWNFLEITNKTESETSASGLPSSIGQAHHWVPKWTYSLLASASFQFGLLKT